MKSIFTIGIFFIFSAWLVSCGGTDTGNPAKTGSLGAPTACTEDAKVCPDNTTVVRDPENACEFFPCP